MISDLALDPSEHTLFIFDLDGTLADDGHIRHLYQHADGTNNGKDPSLDPIVMKMLESMPYHPSILGECLDAHREYEMLILTARTEPMREATANWLGYCGIPPTVLHMAPTYEIGQAHVWKRQWVEAYLMREELFVRDVDHLVVYEDRPQILNEYLLHIPRLVKRFTAFLVNGNSKQLYCDSQVA
jgi:hypothetical protein